MAAANRDIPENRRIVLRVGVNLGDVIVEGSDLYGDGVNIAARLEALAEPGSVSCPRRWSIMCAVRSSLISRTVASTA